MFSNVLYTIFEFIESVCQYLKRPKQIVPKNTAYLAADLLVVFSREVCSSVQFLSQL